MRLVLPMGVIFTITIVAMMNINQIAVNNEQPTQIMNRILLISDIGLMVMSILFIWMIKAISNRVVSLKKIVSRLEIGKNANIDMKWKSVYEPFDELIQDISIIERKNNLLSNVIAMMAEGDMSFEIAPELANNLQGKNLVKIRDSILNLKLETMNLQDNNENICDTNELTGDYYQIMKNIRKGFGYAEERVEFYSGILDAMPYSMLVIDANMRYKYINKQMAAYLRSRGVINEREEAYSLQCSLTGTNLCGTDNCAKNLLEKGIKETTFEIQGKYFKDNIAYIKNKNGEYTKDILEISLDQTSIMSVNVYIKEEVDRLAKNLLCLAKGDLDFDVEIQKPNKHTVEIYEQFNTIGNSLEEVKQSIVNLIKNATFLNRAVVHGELDIRADETKFSGSWRTLIHGMNEILIEIAKPLEEVAKVMLAISVGSLETVVKGDYVGKFGELKQSVNQMGGQLKEIIGEISAVTTSIGKGNLNIDNINIYQGDFLDISTGINDTIKTLNNLLREINAAAQQVSMGAIQVSSGSQSLSQGSTEQASSIEELTASIAEISQQTRNNAKDGESARELAIIVMDNAENGKEQMSKMQLSMTEINQASKEIAQIIKVIDDIAFQTNILALNAAVEAARAGEHGKGFAVVAEEVRTLAARSADAAKVTAELIEETINKVTAGTRIANETAKELYGIVDGIKRTSELVGNVSIASNGQATNISEINIAIEQVSQVIQHNAATSQQSAAASEELLSQAEMLRQSINHFQFKSN